MSVKRVQSAERVLTTLETLAENQPLGVAALARILGEDKSAVQRALVTLAGAGWIRSTGDEVTRWELTARALLVAKNAQRRSDLSRRVHAALETLQAKTGETAIFAVADSGRITVVDVVESREMVRSAPHVGMVVPTEDAATSLAILAHLDAGERRALLGREPDDAFDATLATVRANGWSINSTMAGATSVGAVVLDGSGRPLGALAIAAIAERMPAGDVPTFGMLVASVASSLSA